MTDLTLVSPDPLYQLVDHGFPLYRFKEETRIVEVLDQSQIISKNNNYKPTKYMTKNHIKIYKFRHALPEVGNETDKELLDLVHKDICDNRKLEESDPLKGNSLVITNDGNTKLIVFSAGTSLSNLAVATLSNTTKQVTIIKSFDLKYPIRQITLSPLSNSRYKILLVRTTSSIHLLHVNRDKEIISKHRLFLPDLSEINQKVDYSMPIHVEPSPYFEDQYLFITNNGYTALMDTTKDEILFEDLDLISQDITYQSRWRSCGFGKTPFTIYTATPDYIKEFIIRKDNISTNILAIPNEPIVSFKTTYDSIYCFATTTSIAVMDRLYPERPLVTWLHRMRDGTPTDILIDSLGQNKWRITAFSKHTQRFTMISLEYINNPANDFKPTIKILELFNFQLPILKFEEIFNYKSRINTVGCHIDTVSSTTEDTTEGNVILSIYRSFEDGSITANYVALKSGKEAMIFDPPKYQQISKSSDFNELMSTYQLEILPERDSNRPEVVHLSMNTMKEYIDSIETGSEPLTDDFKRKIANKVRDLKSTVTFRDLFEEEEYQQYKLQDLNDFLDVMEIHEEIERGRQIDTFGIYHQGKPKDVELNSKLKQAHEKEIHLSSVLIRPLRENGNKFRYLDPDVKYNSTTTSKLLSNLWSIDDTPFHQLEFPQYTTNQLLKEEYFPSVNNKLDESHPQSMPEIPMPIIVDTTPKKRKKEESSSLPTQTTFKTDFDAVSTQPLPGVFGSRTKKPIKKKKKTSGFR